MDDRWESEVIEYGAINITGFRIVDDSRPYVKEFLENWRRLDPAVHHGAGRQSISVSTHVQDIGLGSEFFKSIKNSRNSIYFPETTISAIPRNMPPIQSTTYF